MNALNIKLIFESWKKKVLKQREKNKFKICAKFFGFYKFVYMREERGK